MRRSAVIRRVVGTTIAGLALAVTAAAPALAKKSSPLPPTLEVNGQPLAIGSPVLAVSTNFQLKASAWQFVCNETTFTGTLVGSDTISIDEAAFVGGDPHDEELCKSPSELVPTWNPTSPAKFEFAAKGKALLLNARIRLVPIKYEEAPPGKHHGCNPEKAKGKGSYKADETPQPLVANFAGIKWKGLRESGAESACKENPVFSAGFTFSSEGQPIEVVT